MDFIKNFIKEKNFWPQTIVGMIVAVVFLCIWTIQVALDNPVQMSTKYMDKYQSVDDNINEILISNHNFQKLYDVKIDDSNFKIGNSSLSFTILNRKNSEIIKDAKVNILVTRPETREFDKNFENIKLENGNYPIKSLTLEKEGRWKIIYKIQVGEHIGFNELDYNGTSTLDRVEKKKKS